MRKIRVPFLACLIVLAIAGAIPLTACTNAGGDPDASQGMVGGKGPDYNH